MSSHPLSTRSSMNGFPEANTVAGHLWTLGLRLSGSLLYRDPSPWNWMTSLDDPTHGSIRLTGLLDGDQSPHLLVMIHGLGGWARSSYCIRLARQAAKRGWSCLRLNMRGSDRTGEDLYNAALTTDLVATLADPALRRFSTISLVGFSLGGHIVLRYLSENPDARVRAAAAVSPPLALAPVADHLDSEKFWSAYRRFLLRKSVALYQPIVERGRGGIDLLAAQRISTMRDWDEQVIAPRWGYDGAADYYTRASVADRLASISTPTLALVAVSDPMIPSSTLRPFLDPSPAAIETHWVERGGHVALPGLDLGEAAPRGLEPQLLQWLEQRRGG